MRVRVEGQGQPVHFDVPTVWDIVGQVRDTVRAELEGNPRDLVDAAVLGASEFAENLLKYGGGCKTPRCCQLSIRALPDRIVLESRNRLTDAVDGERVVKIIEEIQASPDVEALYAEAIGRNLANQHHQSGISRHGFYRIAAVGGFRLEAEIVEEMLIVRAERSRP